MITIDIMGKLYHIKCPDNEVESLQQAARFFEEKMRKIRENCATPPSHEHLAVIAGLNIAHQCLNAEDMANQQVRVMQQRLLDWQLKIENALIEE